LRVKINGLGALNEEQKVTVKVANRGLASAGVFVVDVGE